MLPLKDRLYRLALRITLNPAEAEDAVQDTLIRVWEHREEWEQIDSIEAYAHTICRNIALDMAGKAGRGNVQLNEDSSMFNVQCSMFNDFDQTYQEIGNILKLTESQVKVYLHRARTSIRQQAEEIEKYGL